MRIKSLSDLKMGLENARKATPTTPFASELPVTGEPGADSTPKRFSAFSQEGFRAMSMVGALSYYTETSEAPKAKEPDPYKDYLGPRFLPPKARLPKRTGQGNLG